LRGSAVLYLPTIVVHIYLLQLDISTAERALPAAKTDPLGDTSNPRRNETEFVCPEYAVIGIVFARFGGSSIAVLTLRRSYIAS